MAPLKQKKIRKAVIIITPDDPENQADIKTGGLTDFEIADSLHNMLRIFCKRIVNSSSEIVGDDRNELIKFIEWQRANGLDKG